MSGFGGGIDFNVDEMLQNFDQFARLQEQTLRKAAGEIKDFAVSEVVDRAPIDEGHLGASIEGSLQGSGHDLAIVIAVPLNAPAAAYTVRMHEDDYQLGPLSAAKQAKLPNITVGNKFIIRALTENQQDIWAIWQHNMKM